MPTPTLRKPQLPSHYSVWFEPPDDAGDEVLHIVSERRAIKLKGHSFREFCEKVVPLLDGQHTIDEIHGETADRFRLEDLTEALNMLNEQGVLREGDDNGQSADVSERMTPQLNFFHEMTQLGRETQAKLAKATVAVVGLGGAGAATALSLAAAGVGTLRCIDSLPIAATDVYLSPFLTLEEVGCSRTESLARRVQASAPQVNIDCLSQVIDSEDEVRDAVAGADFVVCCLDAGQSNLAFKLNRVCLAGGIRWIACALGGPEVTIGPAVHPGEGPCYLCYRMRAVACAGNPEDAFAFERYLDRRKSDDSGKRENLVFGAGLAANLLGIEVLKELTGLAEPSLVGRVLTVQLPELNIEKHAVLRKPWCPACFKKSEPEHAG